MEDSGICIPCIEHQRKISEKSKALQKVQHEAKMYMKEKGLNRIDLIQHVSNENDYSFAEKGDPRVYKDYMIIESILA